MESSLLQRKDIRVDPYRQGFGHLDNTANIDLNAVRLCFQVSKQTQNYELGRTTFLLICRRSCVLWLSFLDAFFQKPVVGILMFIENIIHQGC